MRALVSDGRHDVDEHIGRVGAVGEVADLDDQDVGMPSRATTNTKHIMAIADHPKGRRDFIRGTEYAVVGRGGPRRVHSNCTASVHGASVSVPIELPFRGVRSARDAFSGGLEVTGALRISGRLRHVADVFLSYADQDSDAASRMVASLGLGGIAVSPAHPSPQPRNVKMVARELASAKCVLVLCSDNSLRNELINAEANYARDRGVIVSVKIDPHPVPPKFRDEWCAKLTGWLSESASGDFTQLTALVNRRTAVRQHAASGTRQTVSATVGHNAQQAAIIFLCYLSQR